MAKAKPSRSAVLGHRALFGRGLRWEALAEKLAPYNREEVVLVLTTLGALLAHPRWREAETQRALAHTFFLESGAAVAAKIRAGSVVFQRLQAITGLRLALAHCAGDRATQPTGSAFFEGLARVLVAITDHLDDPKPPPKSIAKRETRERVLAHLNHLLQGEPLPEIDIAAECVRAHALVFERGPQLARQRGLGNLPGAFHERCGVDCERWFAAALHLLAKSLNYSLETMHRSQPVVRIASDFRQSAIESREVERLFAPLSMGLGRAGDEVRHSLEGASRDPQRDLESLRRRPVLHLLEDTYAAADPQLLCEAVATDLGNRLVACSADRPAARHGWTVIVRDHAVRLLAPLTAPVVRADLIHRDSEGRNRWLADWFHVRGSDALLVWVATAPARRDFPTDESFTESNGRLLGALLDAARETTATIQAWSERLCAPGGKKISAVKRIFPLLILERDLPLDAGFQKLFAALCKEEKLLADRRCQPLAVLDLATLEGLAAAAKPPSLLALLAKRAGGKAKSMPLREYLAKQGLPTGPPPEETNARFEKLVKSCRKSLGIP